jgi:hypothetical protein
MCEKTLKNPRKTDMFVQYFVILIRPEYVIKQLDILLECQERNEPPQGKT